MIFIYTKHANLRIKQRNLSTRQIERTILSPDRTLPSFQKRLLVQKKFGHKTLEVIYRKEGEKIIILTAYWLLRRR